MGAIPSAPKFSRTLCLSLLSTYGLDCYNDEQPVDPDIHGGGAAPFWITQGGSALGEKVELQALLPFNGKDSMHQCHQLKKPLIRRPNKRDGVKRRRAARVT